MLYIDTSVLLPYTLTQAVEAARYRSTERFFGRIRQGDLSAATSFYALHELYIFALDNAHDFAEGSAFGKAALEKVFGLPIQILPFVSRTERMRHARRFSRLRDATDVPHAIAASVYQCEAIVAYDEHFSAISDLMNLRKDMRLTQDEFGQRFGGFSAAQIGYMERTGHLNGKLLSRLTRAGHDVSEIMREETSDGWLDSNDSDTKRIIEKLLQSGDKEIVDHLKKQVLLLNDLLDHRRGRR